MRFRSNSLILLGWVIFLTACGQEPSVVTKEGMIRYIDHDPSLNQSREVNGIKVEIKFCPYQLLVSQELENEPNPDSGLISRLEKKYSSHYYFRLFFSKNNKEVIRALGDFHRYSDMLQVFSFEMGQYIDVTTEKNDTLPLADYAFEQDYGMSKANTCLLVFNKRDFSAARNINVNISEFGLETGSLHFSFDRRKLESVPTLDFNHTR